MPEPEPAARYSQSLFSDSLNVTCDVYGEVRCARCNRRLTLPNIAFMTRTAPRLPFDSWCSECALQLCKWAIAGAELRDLEGAAELVRVFGADRR
jgi:hypothetical protein